MILVDRFHEPGAAKGGTRHGVCTRSPPADNQREEMGIYRSRGVLGIITCGQEEGPIQSLEAFNWRFRTGLVTPIDRMPARCYKSSFCVSLPDGPQLPWSAQAASKVRCRQLGTPNRLRWRRVSECGSASGDSGAQISPRRIGLNSAIIPSVIHWRNSNANLARQFCVSLFADIQLIHGCILIHNPSSVYGHRPVGTGERRGQP